MSEPDNTHYKEAFGRNVTRYRQANLTTQEDLAIALGMSRSHLSRIERGSTNVSLVLICRLAEALGVKPADLMSFESKSSFGEPDPRA